MHIKPLINAYFAMFFFSSVGVLAPTRALAVDIAGVGSFQASNLTTNYGGGDDSATASGVTFTNNGFSSGTAFGGGILLSQSFAKSFSVETGLLYLPRSMSETETFSKGSVSGTISENMNFFYLQVPVLARIHFSEFLSIGFGGYYAHAMGNIKYTFSSSNAAVQAALPSGTQYAGYEEGGISRTDFGLLFALGLKLPISGGLSFYADARYALGLENIQTSRLTSINANDASDDNKWHDFQVLSGLSLSL